MRRLLDIIIVAACVLLPQFAMAQSAELKVMSYNVRLGTAKDGTNSWMYRCGATLEMIEDQKPDIMGVQEALDDQVRFIKEFSTDYDFVGVGRDDGIPDSLRLLFPMLSVNTYPNDWLAHLRAISLLCLPQFLPAVINSSPHLKAD